jgi:hypothetical protein
MKKVLGVFSLLLVSLGSVLLVGGNDLGYIGTGLGFLGLFIVDKKLVLGE